MSDQRGMYTSPAPEVERRRLATFEYPNEVSCRALDKLQFDSFIDAAAGPGTGIAEYVVHVRQATYTAFDLNPGMVDMLSRGLKEKEIPANVFEANVLDIPSVVGHADIVHSRFLLMHLPSEEKRRKALGGMLSIADRYVVLLEYNWRTMEAPSVPAVDTFKKLSLELMDALHVDPYAGETMQGIVRNLVPEGCFQFEHDLRTTGNPAELVELCRVQSDFAMKLSMVDLASKFVELAAHILDLKFDFTPPEIVIAIIRA